MGISEKKMQIVINNYFKQECDVNTSIREAFEKGFRIGVKKGQSAQPEQKWIPCSERLPEAKQRVLVTFPDGTVDIKICIDAGHLKWFFAHMVAWMPLPKPYRGE